MAQKIKLGKAVIEPKKPLVAGAYATVAYTYTADHPIDDTGYLKIVFRYAGDFGIPQFGNPKAVNYCSISTNGNCRLMPRWDSKGHTRPWGSALYIKIFGGFLDQGEKIFVIFGDRSGGSLGWQVQTFCETAFEFKTFIDPIATYEFKELPASPVIRIIPGKPVHAVCLAPSQVEKSKKFFYYFKLEDKWGNPIAKPTRSPHPGFSKQGIEVLKIRDRKTGLSAESNPINVTEGKRKFKLFWADFHGQSEETIGTNSIEDYFTFARDYALLDIAAHQGNDFQVTDEFWAKINKMTKAFYQKGRFVTFPGYEWSGNTPLGGDRNVYYKSEGGQITRSCCDLLPGKSAAYRDSLTANDMFKNLKGKEPFVFAHAGGRYADMAMHDPKIEIASEIHSAWGTFEWLAEDALEKGCRIGICANSDDHKGRPGASYPGASKFGSLGGLTCILAERLDRASIHKSLMKRHFYATTGNRCILDVSVITSDKRKAIIGDVIEAGKGTSVLKVRLTGTAPIEQVEIRNGLDRLDILKPFTSKDLGKRIKILWSGAEVRGRARMCEWHGSLTIKGNHIKSITPVNFWNAFQPLRKVNDKRLEWRSVATGGVAGMILELDKIDSGMIFIETAQGKCKCLVKNIGLNAKVKNYGGLSKQLRIYRLPAKEQAPKSFEFEKPLKHLRKGDNPIYICMSQEDGHMVWTSPIYVC